jgi:ATP-dependent helicase STH1/SNF2
MAQIKRKINRKDYQNVKEFYADMKLLCDNCRTYNEDGSILYSDANLIEQTTIQKLNEETRDAPEWRDFTTPSYGYNGTSTGPVSSSGTPMGGGG